MSEIKTFFRFCPSCGRRFHIRLVSKTLVNVQRERLDATNPVMLNPQPPSGYTPGPPLMVQEEEPITVDVEEFRYSYKCKHCGHEWSETHVEEHVEG